MAAAICTFSITVREMACHCKETQTTVSFLCYSFNFTKHWECYVWRDQKNSYIMRITHKIKSQSRGAIINEKTLMVLIYWIISQLYTSFDKSVSQMNKCKCDAFIWHVYLECFIFWPLMAANVRCLNGRNFGFHCFLLRKQITKQITKITPKWKHQVSVNVTVASIKKQCFTHQCCFKKPKRNLSSTSSFHQSLKLNRNLSGFLNRRGGNLV